MKIFSHIVETSKQRPLLATLVDPDKIKGDKSEFAKRIASSSSDLIFVGGSLIFSDVDDVVLSLKANTDKPVILFPGLSSHFTPHADALLFLSLLSGRNPDFLINNQVHAAVPVLKSGIETIPTAYLLIDGGRTTSVEYMSNTKPIPADKPDIALATAAAAKLMGFKMIYLECGSGAARHVPASFISLIKKEIGLPLIVGGGIKTEEDLKDVVDAGADIIVVGTAFEEHPELIDAFSALVSRAR